MLHSESDIRQLFEQARTIAILGAKDKPGQPVDMVGRYLIQAGYEVIPVHPVRQNVWGRTTYKTLAEVPEAIDIVDVFRAPQFCPGHAREALALDPLPKCFWMQLSIASSEARNLLEGSGVMVVEDRCTKVDHGRLLR